MSGKTAGHPTVALPKPTISLHGSHAKAFAGKNLGDKASFTVHGEISGTNSDRFGGKDNHSATVTVHRLQHHGAAGKLASARLKRGKGRAKGYDNSLGNNEYPGGDPANVPGNHD